MGTRGTRSRAVRKDPRAVRGHEEAAGIEAAQADLVPPRDTGRLLGFPSENGALFPSRRVQVRPFGLVLFWSRGAASPHTAPARAVAAAALQARAPAPRWRSARAVAAAALQARAPAPRWRSARAVAAAALQARAPAPRWRSAWALATAALQACAPAPRWRSARAWLPLRSRRTPRPRGGARRGRWPPLRSRRAPWLRGGARRSGPPWAPRWCSARAWPPLRSRRAPRLRGGARRSGPPRGSEGVLGAPGVRSGPEAVLGTGSGCRCAPGVRSGPEVVLGAPDLPSSEAVLGRMAGACWAACLSRLPP
jgi:hypothetical protein